MSDEAEFTSSAQSHMRLDFIGYDEKNKEIRPWLIL